MELIKRLLLCFFLFVFVGENYAQTQSARAGLFSDKPRTLLIEPKVGRGFLKAVDSDVEIAGNVFSGAIGLNYGIKPRSFNALGLGVNVEYIDLLDGTITFPLYLFYRQWFLSNGQGPFIDLKAGYIVGVDKSFMVYRQYGGLLINGSTTRKPNYPYMEVALGFTFQQFDFFVSYNYRVVHYETRFIYLANNIPNYDSFYQKNMHIVSAGLSYRLF